MKEEDIKAIFEEYTRSLGYAEPVIISRYFNEIIKKILTLNTGSLAELEAKVYTYEKIIANSNFKPILDYKNKALGDDK